MGSLRIYQHQADALHTPGVYLEAVRLRQAEATTQYAAPTSNPNCANNAMITLTDYCGDMACIKLAVTTNLGTALRQCRFVVCSVDPNTQIEYGLIECEWWNCDGTSAMSSCYTAAGSQRPCPWCWTGPCDCGRYWGDDGYYCARGAKSFQCATCVPPPNECDLVTDTRTPAMKEQGCCPIDPTTGLPFGDGTPNCEAQAKKRGEPDCKELEGNPANVSTGNKYEEVLDLSILTSGIPLDFRRSYNSQVIFDGALGFHLAH